MGAWPLSFPRFFIDGAKDAAEVRMMAQTSIAEPSNERRLLSDQLRKHGERMAVPMAAAQGYDATYLLTYALFGIRDGKLDGPAVKNALENIKRVYYGVVATYERPFTPRGQGRHHRNMLVMGKVQNGAITFAHLGQAQSDRAAEEVGTPNERLSPLPPTHALLRNAAGRTPWRKGRPWACPKFRVNGTRCRRCSRLPQSCGRWVRSGPCASRPPLENRRKAKVHAGRWPVDSARAGGACAVPAQGAVPVFTHSPRGNEGCWSAWQARPGPVLGLPPCSSIAGVAHPGKLHGGATCLGIGRGPRGVSAMSKPPSSMVPPRATGCPGG